MNFKYIYIYYNRNIYQSINLMFVERSLSSENQNEKKESSLEKAKRYIRDQSSPMLNAKNLLSKSKNMNSFKYDELMNLYCPICHEMATKTTISFFNHTDQMTQTHIECNLCHQMMHSDCLNRWKKYHDSCPNCQETI